MSYAIVTYINYKGVETFSDCLTDVSSDRTYSVGFEREQDAIDAYTLYSAHYFSAYPIVRASLVEYVDLLDYRDTYPIIRDIFA